MEQGGIDSESIDGDCCWMSNEQLGGASRD